MTPLLLRSGDVAIAIAPERGGGLLGFHWRGQPVFADVRGDAPTDMACVPLLPFANRIANGRFVLAGRQNMLPRLPGEAHALHGEGWLSAWGVADAGPTHATLDFDHPAHHWPWHYRAVQHLRLTDDGYHHTLHLTNLDNTPMPAGLGLHPWLPSAATTVYHGLHTGRWQMGEDQLPREAVIAAVPQDWWHGTAVASQIVDTCFIGRVGDLAIAWPERGMALTMTPSPVLCFTHVYVPGSTDFFCVEPVSHSPDAIHRPGEPGLVWLQPGETLSADVTFRVSAL